MNQKNNSLTAAALLSALISLPAWAQDPEQGDTETEQPAELEDLIVTATLEPMAASEVAASVTVITREQIEQRQVKYLADLLRDVPGFSISQAGGAGAQTQLRVRGAEANQMLVLIDGIRANDPASADEFQFQYALASNIERIEIIRGPQSPIWGSDAMAGVINIIRRKDTRDSWLGGYAEGGSFDTFNGALDGGISRDRLQLNGGLAYSDTEGFNIARQGQEKDGADNLTAHLGLTWDLGEAWQLVAAGQHVEAETQFDDVDFFVTGLPVDTDRVTRAERNYLRGEVRYKPIESRWSGAASLNYTDTDNRNFYDGEWNSSTAAEVFDARLRGSLLMGSGHDDAEHRVTGAIDYIQTDFAQRGIAVPWGDPNQDQDYDQSSLAAEYVGKLFNGFTWTASARYNDFSDFDSISTWQVAFSHQVSDLFRVRGSVGTGFKAPTFTERFGFYADQFIGNPDLKPEQSKGWELGFDSHWLDGRLDFGLVYFDHRLKDEIDGFVFDLDRFLYTAQNKESDSQRSGVEAVFDWALTRNLDLSGNYTYTDATEDDAQGGSLRELRRPRHLANLNAHYRFFDERAYANFNLSYTGSQIDVFYDPATYASERVELGSYTIADLSGGWKFNQRLELTARVTNLTDEEYEDVLGYTTRGRAWYLGIRGRFDL